MEIEESVQGENIFRKKKEILKHCSFLLFHRCAELTIWRAVTKLVARDAIVYPRCAELTFRRAETKLVACDEFVVCSRNAYST